MNKKRILAVDDLLDVRTTVAGILRDEGHVVETCGSAAETLAYLQRESFDLVLLDIRLDDSDAEDISGLKLAAEIGNRWPNIPIIILTGFPTLDYVKEAFTPNKVGRRLVTLFLQKKEIIKLPEFIANLP